MERLRNFSLVSFFDQQEWVKTIIVSMRYWNNLNPVRFWSNKNLMEKNFHEDFFFMHEKVLYLMKDQGKYLVNQDYVSEQKKWSSYIILSFISLDHVKDIDEIRSGYHAQTFDRLIKRGILKPKDVYKMKKFDSLRTMIYLFRNLGLFLFCMIIIGRKYI